jgi:hypothetical protein
LKWNSDRPTWRAISASFGCRWYWASMNSMARVMRANSRLSTKASLMWVTFISMDAMVRLGLARIDP